MPLSWCFTNVRYVMTPLQPNITALMYPRATEKTVSDVSEQGGCVSVIVDPTTMSSPAKTLSQDSPLTHVGIKKGFLPLAVTMTAVV